MLYKMHFSWNLLPQVSSLQCGNHSYDIENTCFKRSKYFFVVFFIKVILNIFILILRQKTLTDIDESNSRSSDTVTDNWWIL